jgi:hypothetical protein
MGAYTDILRHTPDHEDLVTATDSEVMCRVVGRWVGQGGKDSLDNTTDVDIEIPIDSKIGLSITIDKLRVFINKTF